MGVTALSHAGRLAAAVVLIAAFWALGPAPADARPADGSGREELRTAGTCGRGATSRLRLRSDDGSIEVRFEIRGRARAHWDVVLVHERRVVWRGSVRAGRTGYLRVRRDIPDYAGADEIMGRGIGPGGITCTAAGTLLA
jgi:hypothetical protein